MCLLRVTIAYRHDCDIRRARKNSLNFSFIRCRAHSVDPRLSGGQGMPTPGTGKLVFSRFFPLTLPLEIVEAAELPFGWAEMSR